MDSKALPPKGTLIDCGDIDNLTIAWQSGYHGRDDEVLRMRHALQDIVKHQELAGGAMDTRSTTRAIALRGLGIEL